MFRNLSAIEIAEGALLADIAVIFQLLSIYLPVGGIFFHLPTFIVFALLVLRRGLYVGILGLCVALFITGVITGQALPIMFLSGAGGLFLGITMKLRLPHIPLLLLGITGGALSLYGLLLILTILTGQSLTMTILDLHRAYNAVVSLVGVLATHLGLGTWWKQSLQPFFAWLANLLFTYWLITFYLALWALLSPFVFLIYVMTNWFMRLLGYDVRPFPGVRFEKLMHRLARGLIKSGIRRGLIKRSGAKA
ncbi:MAG TPA: DUF2232 domain-containing protein [Ktedonobacteraceae bacterium]|nr:DUF2232 domain-containing protein [Ktedonobacteraceae bacterium]